MSYTYSAPSELKDFSETIQGVLHDKAEVDKR